jgi:hypothetical protein
LKHYLVHHVGLLSTSLRKMYGLQNFAEAIPLCDIISTYIYIYTHTNTYTYIYRCPRRDVPDFRRVLLMLKYTDITQNTYIQN